ncbi:hypothetical protein PV325_006642 [Microctonus aethiopoides]|nr:hypothetical protein PV325_006642 [Microctonus aethiopoides]
MLRISTITKIICIIILELVILDLGKTEFQAFRNNNTQHESPWKLDRQKRSRIDSMPSRLKIALRDGDGNKIFLKWERQRSFLANKYLPIITPLADLNLNVMDDIGEMLMYHDQDANSAVVYFEKSDQFLGLLGTDHYIEDLPNYFDDDGNYRLESVGEPYVVKLNNKFPHNNPLHYFPAPSDWLDEQEIPGLYNSSITSSELLLNIDYLYSIHPNTGTSGNNIPSGSRSNKRPLIEPDMDPNKKSFSNLDAGPSKKQSTSSDSVPRNSLSDPTVKVQNANAKGNKKAFGNEYIPWIVRYYIIFFNAVDMLIAQLQLCVYLSGLHINIAKIVIEDRLVPFKFLENGVVEFSEIVANTRQYLYLFRDMYPQDSFDHVFITTRRQIVDKYLKVDGLTSHDTDMFEAIKNDRFYSAVPITVMRFKSYYADYIRTAPEFARLFGVTYDSWEKETHQSGQCYSIMQRGGPKCDNCMLWSDKSKKQFKDFINNNRYYCFLLNEPRSLFPPGVIELSSTTKICRCLGYYHHKHFPEHWAWRVFNFGCNRPIQCIKHRNKPFTMESVNVLPFDGTPCGYNHVCWERQCKPVNISKRQIP